MVKADSQTILIRIVCSIFVALLVAGVGLMRLQLSAPAAPPPKQSSATVWHPYSHDLVKRCTSSGRHVIVNFRASWDISTVMHEHVFDSPQVSNLMQSKKVVSFEADWATMSEAKREPMFEFFDQVGLITIPAIVIFPAGNFDNPIVFDTGDITTENLATAIEGLPAST